MQKKALLLAAALLACLPFTSASLQKGGTTKQFTAYSISESLSRNSLAPLSSSVPCAGSPGWAEEPPVFHEVAAVGLLAFPGVAWLAPVFFYLLLVFSAAWLLESILPAPPFLVLLAVALSPAFLRNSIQHMPDLPGTALLLLGAALLLHGRRKPSVFVFALSVAAKALTGPAAVALLFWDECQKEKRSWSSWALKSAVIALPFIAWVLLLKWKGIPSPFLFSKGVTENRHSGEWAILLDLSYYRRVLNWLALQGSGLALFVPGVIWALRTKNFAPKEKALLFWALAVIPFILMVRRGNWLHDYYILPFVFPFSAMGAIALTRWTGKWDRRFAKALLVVSVANGVYSLARLEPYPLAKGQTRPIYCGLEDFR